MSSEANGDDYQYESRWLFQEDGTRGTALNENNDKPSTDTSLAGVFVSDLFSNCDSLELEIKELECRLASASREETEQNDRFVSIEQHMKQLELDIKYSNDIITARRNEIATEKQIYSIALRGEGKFDKDFKNLVISLDGTKQTLEMRHTQLFKVQKEIDILQAQLNWNEEELQKWVHSVSQKDSEVFFLQKHNRDDDSKIQYLNLQIEKLNTAVIMDKAQLQNETSSLQAYQRELDNVEGAFKCLHAERNSLLNHWQATLQTMKQKDIEIRNIVAAYGQRSQIKEQKENSINSSKANTQFNKADILALKQSIEESDKDNVAKKEKLVIIHNSKDELMGELDVISRENESGRTSTTKVQVECKIGSKQLQHKQEQITQAQERLDSAKKHLIEQQHGMLSKEDSAGVIREYLSKKEKELRAALKEVTDLKQQVLAETKFLQKLREDELTLISTINTLEATGKSQKGKLTDLEKEVMRLHATASEAGSRVQQAEAKLARGMGVRKTDEKNELIELKDKCEVTQKRLAQEKQQMINQIKKVSKERQVCVSRREQCIEDAKHLEMQQKDTYLDNSSLERNLAHSLEKMNESILENDRLTVYISTLRNKLYGLLKSIDLLKNSINELFANSREIENNIWTESKELTASIRASQSEFHNLSLALCCKKSEARRTEAKLEVFSAYEESKNSDQLQSLAAVNHLKEQLQKQGDLLFQELTSQEDQLKAMKHTLLLLKERNKNFVHSFKTGKATEK